MSLHPWWGNASLAAVDDCYRYWRGVTARLRREEKEREKARLETEMLERWDVWRQIGDKVAVGWMEKKRYFGIEQYQVSWPWRVNPEYPSYLWWPS